MTRRHGFTLLEVLIAALVMALMLVALTEVIGRSIKAYQVVQRETELLPLAQSKMDEILKEPVIQLGEDRGNYGAELPQYEWEAVIEASIDPNVLTVRVRAFELERPENQIILTCLRRAEVLPLPPPQPTETPTGGATL